MTNRCLNCGRDLVQKARGRRRSTCSATCRTFLWERRSTAKHLLARAATLTNPTEAQRLREQAARWATPGPLTAQSWTTPMTEAELLEVLRGCQ